MKRYQNASAVLQVLPIFLFLLLSGCDSQIVEDDTSPAIANSIAPIPLAIAIADTVSTNVDANVYQRANTSSSILGVASAGSIGVVERGPRNDMWQIRFVEGSTLEGWVLESQLDEHSGGGDPPPPPPPPPSDSDIALGGASCSMGRDFFLSYEIWKDNNPGEVHYPHWPKESDSGDKITKSWSGGGLDTWGVPGAGGYNIKWTSFDNGVAHLEPTVLLFMVCSGDTNFNGVVDQEEIDMAKHVSEQMLARVPNAQLWITGEPRHEPGSACDAPAQGLSHALADSAAAHGYFQRADIDIVLTPEMVKPTGCHVDGDGLDYEGPIMAAWLSSLDE